MAIRCPQCGAEYDVAKFEEDQKISCHCGFKLDLSLIETTEDFLRYCEGNDEHQKAKEIQRDAQLICRMILDHHSAAIDIELARTRLETKVSTFFPDKIETYRMIYESRFKRLWEQFRSENG